MALKQLQSPPRLSDIHLWADYAELLCLVNVDGRVTKADVLARWQKGDDLEEDLLDGGLPVEDEEFVAPSEQPKDVLRENKLGDVFSHLTYRATVFESAYPFNIEGDSTALQRRRMTRDRRLYSFLLLASSQRYLEPGWATAMTRAFERLAFVATRAWLPEPARVYAFGTDRSMGNRYKGPLRERLRLLAEDLSEELKVKEGDLAPQDVGDAGCDVVAWLPFADGLGAQLVVIGQATCQADWKNKQGEPSWDAWRRLIDFTVPTNALFFVPFCWRRPDGQWFKPLDVRSILLDRVRLMWLLKGRRLISIPDPVQEAIAFREQL